MQRSSKHTVPPVILWSGALYLVLLVSTILVWFLESRGPEAQGHRLYEPMVDGLKVGLGALIGVLSQWAHYSFHASAEHPAEESTASL
jgi:hypothetical protein